MVKNMINALHLELPPISLRLCDLDRLRNLADAASHKYPETADFLSREIERADILPDSRALPGLVTMNSQATFRDDFTGQERTVTLVYPEEADVEAGKISVLTPIGAALIGLSAGQTIEFRIPGGRWRSLTLLKAIQPD